MTDEHWIDWNSAYDEDYYNAVERDFLQEYKTIENSTNNVFEKIMKTGKAENLEE